MRDFAGKIAVITGGGTGMGRELARQLMAQGCDVAMCDVSAENLAEASAVCTREAPQGVRLTTFRCDVADPAQMEDFAQHVADTFATSHINLLFNNAGIAGAGSFINDDPALWARIFDICWGGVYNGCRAFMPLLLRSEEGHIINTSSINGFWASSGPNSAHTAYSAAKFAVKGFTEALITDLRLNAPQIRASVVMPGHVGTSILLNSQLVAGDPDAGRTDVGSARTLLNMMNIDHSELSDVDADAAAQSLGTTFRDNAPTTASAAATIILDGVKAERWRILVGSDANTLDAHVREHPEEAYELSFLADLAAVRAAAQGDT
ncbi:MAG: SDR family NAD(P)-dependent oxidoreductase [Pseudomonadota bacterium]